MVSSIGPTHKSRSRQASGLLAAGTNPSKVAARLSLADLLLMVLLGAGTSVSSSTDVITDATVAFVRAFIIGDMVARSMFSVNEESVMSSAVNGSVVTLSLVFVRVHWV